MGGVCFLGSERNLSAFQFWEFCLLVTTYAHVLTLERPNSATNGERRDLQDPPYSTNASRGLSATAEFLVTYCLQTQSWQNEFRHMYAQSQSNNETGLLLI